MTENPLIHLFKTPYHHYVYEANGDDLYSVDSDVYEALNFY